MKRPLGSSRVPAQRCPNCLCKLDAATPIDKDLNPPEPNDYTVCIACQQILQFNDALILHKRTFEEVHDSVKPSIAKLIDTMRKHLPRIKAEEKAKRN